MSAKVDRVVRVTQQLVGDIGRLPGVNLDPAGEAQLVQLLADAFETVGHIALDQQELSESGKFYPGHACPDIPPLCVADNCGFAEPHSHGSGGIYPARINP